MKYLAYICLFICGTLFAQTKEFMDAAAKDKPIAAQLHFAKPRASSKLLLPTKIAIVDSGSNYYVIKAIINGKGPYQFLIDTGTSFTLLSKKIVHELKLPHIKNVPFKVNGQNQNVDFYQIKELAIGDAKILNYDIAVFEEPSLIDHFREEKNIQIEGIIGFGAFYAYILTLDFPKMEVVLESNELNIEDKDTLPYFHSRSVPMIPIIFKDDVNQSSKIHFIVDSGFSGFFFMPSVTQTMPFKIHEVKTKTVLTGLGKFEVVENKIEANAYFSNQKIESPEVMYGSEIYGKLAAPYGLMGLKVINQFRISFDQKNYLIKIEVNDFQAKKLKEKPNVP